ncbi:MAG: hypothetical protein JOZ83_09315 [Silvibacterium sp.]|nr:hypothetical protein [Silvibacterium sp.]
MKVLCVAGLVAIGSVLAIGLSKPESLSGHEQPDSPNLPLHSQRTSPNDLELSGDVPGSQPYTGYISYDELLKLPQVTFTVTDDANFPGKAELGGVPLDALMRALGIQEKNTLVAAVCNDGYEAHYSADYRAAHHPFLITTINGSAPALVKRSGDEGSYGPYLVSHEEFVPRYQVLAHGEEAQIPNGVIELRFLREAGFYDAIRPPGHFASASPQMQGYQIARENCLRCHNAGGYGGTKAGITWGVLGKIARQRPGFFRAYTKDPLEESDYAEMPGFPEYDDTTLRALTAYFQTVGVAQAHMAGHK